MYKDDHGYVKENNSSNESIKTLGNFATSSCTTQGAMARNTYINAIPPYRSRKEMN